VTCDAIGCIGRLADGRLASMALEVEAFAENCARAAVVERPRGTIIELCGNRWSIAGSGARMAPSHCAGAANTSSKALHFHRATDVRGHV
jgi:hypothetical protein